MRALLAAMAAIALVLSLPLTAAPAKAAAVTFLAPELTTQNAREGEPFEATVKGLAKGSGLTFSKVDGPSWLSVSEDGRLTGTPDAAGSVQARVAATNDEGEATLTVTTDVKAEGEPLVDDFRAMTWNLWLSGTQVNDSLNKQLRYLMTSDVDAVALQESTWLRTKSLADALGWDFATKGTTGIISRYPIAESTQVSGQPALEARLDLGGRELSFWGLHLGYSPYGPYDACFGKMSEDELLEREEQSGRAPQIRGIVGAMEDELASADDVPVVVAGDFNSPSSLDWTEQTARCGYGAVPWPASTVPLEAGLVDTFRAANPDPVETPGNTWSPTYKTFTGGYGYDEFAGEEEPQDRIDLIYSKGQNLEVTGSETVAPGTVRPQPDHRDNDWPSDHTGVVTTFALS